ncbi:uncharacterized protein LOC119164919 [Rhipicephalus microplus]|uniref:uncharacterized protein LOC119164919 n=1 Tax=Rhipicephalus microplus TaxID=6941 RepID=UPI003F6B0FEC
MSFSDHDDLAALGHILAHLVKAVKAEEGVDLSRLRGVLSQLPRSVLGPYNANEDTIKLIAKQFPDSIVVVQDKVYTLEGLGEKQFRLKSCKPAEKQQQLASGDPPAELNNVAGSISKLLMLYGFVCLEPPYCVSVFFDKRLFDGNRHNDLTKSWLKVGDRVLIDAVRSPPGHRAKYQATRIQALKKMQQNPAPSRMPREAESGVIYGRIGTIQAVNPSHGFIVFGQDNKQCAAFYIHDVHRSLLKPRKNLDDIFKVGSKVQFDIRSNPKPSTIAKWLATNITKAPCDQSGQASDSGDEAFLSYSEIAERSIKTKEFSARKKLSGIRGAFYPNSKNTGLVAAFDQNIIVRVVVDVAYCGGKKLKSFVELMKDCSLQDEVEVFVDAVEAEQDKWVATLMWTGDRPLHPLVDQSECAFRSALPLALADMPAVPCKGTDNVEAPTKFCANAEHNVAVYPNSKGILKVVDDNRAICEVQEPEGCRNIEFLTFHKNRVPRVGQFKSVLQEGDVVQVDYLVCTVGGKDEVCCRVVWQGDRPMCNRLISPTEFSLMLKGRASAERLADVMGGQQGGSRSLQDLEAPKWPSVTGIASLTAMDAGGHPSAKEPKVYSFVSLKGTVMEVDLSAAIVEVREGPSVRELTITVDNFYNEGRPYLNNLTRVLRKGAIINVDYMVGRVGGEDFVHCDVAWLGPKPKGAPRLTEEEFRQQLCGRGSSNTFIKDLQSSTLELNNLFKDAQRGPAVGNHHKSMEMYRQSPQVNIHQEDACQPPTRSHPCIGIQPQTGAYQQAPQVMSQVNICPQKDVNQTRTLLPSRTSTHVQPKAYSPLPQSMSLTDNSNLQMEAYRESLRVASQTADTSLQMKVAPSRTSEPHSTDTRHLPELTSSDGKARQGNFPFNEEMYKRIVEMTKEEVWAQICAEIKDALQDWQKQVSENAPTSQGQGDDGTAVGTTEWQPRSGSCPNVSQKPDVAAASSRPLETFLDAAVRKREVKPPPGFHIPPSSALVERKPEPVSIASARQTSNILHQPGASWCASTSQFEGHPQASSNINATSVVLAESPVAAIHSSWHFSNVPQQPGVAAASSPARVSQQTWLGGGQPSSFEMRQDVSPFQGHGSNQKDVQDFGIAFDDSLVEGEELSEDDIRRLGLLDP